jgi:hypothetical protein
MNSRWVAVVKMGWALQDRLNGLARIGDSALLPHDFQAGLLQQIGRRRAAIAENSLMIERHNFDGYLDGLSAAQEKLWLDYGRRLMNDADATFSEELPQSCFGFNPARPALRRTRSDTERKLG